MSTQIKCENCLRLMSINHKCPTNKEEIATFLKVADHCGLSQEHITAMIDNFHEVYGYDKSEEEEDLKNQIKQNASLIEALEKDEKLKDAEIAKLKAQLIEAYCAD